MKTVFFLCLVVALTLPSAFAAPAWKPYDDFEGDLDAIDETPGQIPDLGTKWVRSLIICRFLGIISTINLRIKTTRLTHQGRVPEQETGDRSALHETDC